MPYCSPIEGHHLVGARRAARIGETALEELVPIWTRITSKIIKYGFAITYQDLEHKLSDLQHTQDKARFMETLKAYEFEAARFGLQLLHEAGAGDVEQWYSDFVHTDWRYVERYYQIDAVPPWNECIVTNAPRIQAAPIPPLQHRQVEVRFAF